MAVASRLALPVQRQAALAGFDPVPTHRQPQFGPLIALVSDEGHHLAIGNQAAGQLERRDVNRVPGRFIVKRKCAVKCCVKSVLPQAAVVGVPTQRLGRRAGQRPALGVGRALRVERQGMLNVGQQQFLMLLFMLEPQLDELPQLCAICVGDVGNDVQHSHIHLRPVGKYILQRRTADQTAFGARILISDAVVIAVEQDAKTAVERLKAGLEPLQNEGFKKPGQVRQMPFGRTGVRHGLELAVFCA